MDGWVYILQSLKNGRYYVGSTNDLERRLSEHNSGKCKYTSKTGPWKLEFSQKFTNLSVVRKVEFWLKMQKDSDFIRRIITEGKITRIFS